MSAVTALDPLSERLARSAESRQQPITDPSLTERMKTEATTWINAAHMQHRRISKPIIDPNNPGEEVWRQEIDLHFYLIAITRLRRAIALASKVRQLEQALNARIAEFDRQIPCRPRLRNVGEHFDDYTIGRGRDAQINRAQLQVWSLGSDSQGHLTWNWLGEELRLAETHLAATELYRGFIADTEQYFSDLRDQGAEA